MEQKNRFGWLDLVIGIMFIFLAFLVFQNPSAALVEFIIIYGVIAIIKGIAGVILFFSLKSRINKWNWAIIIMAVLDIIVGFILVTDIYVGMISLATILPIWFLFSAITGIINIQFIKELNKTSYWIGIILYAISIVLAIMLMFQPTTAVLTFAYILGFYALDFGIVSIMEAFD